MRFEHGQSRYSRYARVSRAQRGRLVIYAVLLVAVVAAMFALRQKRPGPIEWLLTFEEASARAKADGKPIMAFFYAEGNENCRRMERETFADEAVRAEARHFVCVRLDGNAHPDLVKRYLVIAYPAVAFISPSGERLPVILDYRSPEQFVREMQDVLNPEKLPPVPADQRTTAENGQELTESPRLPPKNAEPSRGDAE